MSLYFKQIAHCKEALTCNKTFLALQDEDLERHVFIQLLPKVRSLRLLKSNRENPKKENQFCMQTFYTLEPLVSCSLVGNDMARIIT